MSTAAGRAPDRRRGLRSAEPSERQRPRSHGHDRYDGLSRFGDSLWVERAAERTVKHLREDVDAACLTARLTGAALVPPDAETLGEVHDLERAALAGVPWARMSVAPSAKTRRYGSVPLRLNLTAEVADLWTVVKGLYDRRGSGSAFVGALAANITRYWSPEPVARPFEDVYRRDRYRCQSPTCDRRDVGAHHVVFRAHGGGDEAGHLVTLCGRCYIDCVHAGRLRVTGTAPDDLRWELAGITVDGRARA